jgi:hypothetical protein
MLKNCLFGVRQHSLNCKVDENGDKKILKVLLVIGKLIWGDS